MAEHVNAPRDDLVRMVPTRDSDLRASDDGRTLVGYPIVFNSWTNIDSVREGTFSERIAPSAVNRTLRDHGDRIKVLFNHGMDPTIGDKPLGRPRSMQVDDTGLRAEVPLSDTSYNQDIAALVRDGAIDGMSFRFSIPKGGDRMAYPGEDGHDPKVSKLPQRTITDLTLYEFGPVTFPAYEASSLGIRARDLFDEWRGLDDGRRELVRSIMTRATTEIPAADHAAALGSVLDALDKAIDDDDFETAGNLSTAAGHLADTLIGKLGGSNTSSDYSPADTYSASAEMSALQDRTTAARERLVGAKENADRSRAGQSAATMRRIRAMATLTKGYRNV